MIRVALEILASSGLIGELFNCLEHAYLFRSRDSSVNSE